VLVCMYGLGALARAAWPAGRGGPEVVPVAPVTAPAVDAPAYEAPTYEAPAYEAPSEPAPE
jgi:hypothetical protein